MYIHIGNDIILHKKDILGIFNLKYIKNTKEFKSLYNNLKENNKIIDMANEDKKSFIITQKNDEVTGFITKIGVNTILKRMF